MILYIYIYIFVIIQYWWFRWFRWCLFVASRFVNTSWCCLAPCPPPPRRSVSGRCRRIKTGPNLESKLCSKWSHEFALCMQRSKVGIDMNRLIYSRGSFIPPWMRNRNGQYLEFPYREHVFHCQIISTFQGPQSSHIHSRQQRVQAAGFGVWAAVPPSRGTEGWVSVPTSCPPKRKNVWLLPRMTDTCPNPTGERFGNIIHPFSSMSIHS